MPSPRIPDVLSDQMAQLRKQNLKLRNAAAIAINNIGSGHVSERTGKPCLDCAHAVEVLRRALAEPTA